MLDQDTARALLTIADETDARVALAGTGTNSPPSAEAGCWTTRSHGYTPQR